MHYSVTMMIHLYIMLFLHSASATTSTGSVNKKTLKLEKHRKTSIRNALARFPQKGFNSLFCTFAHPARSKKQPTTLKPERAYGAKLLRERAGSPSMSLINNHCDCSRHELMEAAISLLYEALGDNAKRLYICSGKYLMMGRNRHI